MKTYVPKYQYNYFGLYRLSSAMTKPGVWSTKERHLLGTYKVREDADLRRAFLYRLHCVGITCNNNKAYTEYDNDETVTLYTTVTRQPLYRFARKEVQ